MIAGRDRLRRRADWHVDLRHRLGAHWLAKMLGTTLGIAAFFVAYFWVLRHPIFAVALMPSTALDRWVGFRPETLPLYLSLWVYVSLGPALLANRRELVAYAWAALGIGAVGLGVFVVWPTRVPHFDVDGVLHPAIALLHGVDVANNACPSLHVAFSVFTAVGLERALREMRSGYPLRAINVLWCLGILYSTLALRQHVVLDVVAGTALGGIGAALYLCAIRRAAPGRMAAARR